jgi:NADH-quinone oxidoreductase subunit K
MLDQIQNFHIFLVLAQALFCIGFYAVLTRKNLILILIGIELMVNAALINFISFDQFMHHNEQGEIMGIMVLVLSAASIAIALAVIIRVHKLRGTINPDQLTDFKN